MIIRMPERHLQFCVMGAIQISEVNSSQKNPMLLQALLGMLYYFNHFCYHHYFILFFFFFWHSFIIFSYYFSFFYISVFILFWHYFCRVIIKDTPLPLPNHGHVILTNTRPILAYQVIILSYFLLNAHFSILFIFIYSTFLPFHLFTQ